MTQYSGIWPVAPTPFFEDGAVDFDGMKRVLDCLIDQGADGICILANFSRFFSSVDRQLEFEICSTIKPTFLAIGKRSTFSKHH